MGGHLTWPWEVHSQLFCKHWFTWINCLGWKLCSQGPSTKTSSPTFWVLTLYLTSSWAIPRVSTSNSNSADHFGTQHGQNCTLKPGLELTKALSAQPVGFIDENPLNICCMSFLWSRSTIWSFSNKTMWLGRRFVLLDDLLQEGHMCMISEYCLFSVMITFWTCTKMHIQKETSKRVVSEQQKINSFNTVITAHVYIFTCP